MKKITPKPKEFWEKKIEGWQKKIDANKRKLEKYSNLVEKIQNDWADTWVELQIRRYMQYNNRAIFDEIVGDAEAKAERGDFFAYSPEFYDWVYKELEEDIDYVIPVALKQSYDLRECLGEISCVLIEDQGDQFWVNRLNEKLKIKKKLDSMKDGRGFYVIN
jgi:uncharacterized protein YeeX (DUF496 family)